MSKSFLNIAHRGASSYAPENTFAAYDKALALGTNHIELDVHFTNDDHVIVIHDDTVDRTTNGSGLVVEHTLAELRALDAGSWFGLQYVGEKIRTLGEVLEHYKGRHHFHIEIKADCSPGLPSRVMDLVRGYGVANDTTITSLCKSSVDESRAYAPEMPTGWLVTEGRGSQWEDSIANQALKSGFTQICPRADILTPQLVEMLHSKGFFIRCHGITNEGLMRHVVECGADGMTINFPDKLIEYLETK